MLRLVLSLRFVMLVASFGAAVGAFLMFWQGAAEMAGAALTLASGGERAAVITAIMHGTDAFLFGIVLVIFAYAIAFGFVFDASLEGWDSLPGWMRIGSVSELKDTLVEVILLYLLVDVATDWPQSEGEISWQLLAKPLAILAIAAAFSLFATLHSLRPRSKHGLGLGAAATDARHRPASALYFAPAAGGRRAVRPDPPLPLASRAVPARRRADRRPGRPALPGRARALADGRRGNRAPRVRRPRRRGQPRRPDPGGAHRRDPAAPRPLAGRAQQGRAHPADAHAGRALRPQLDDRRRRGRAAGPALAGARRSGDRSGHRHGLRRARRDCAPPATPCRRSPTGSTAASPPSPRIRPIPPNCAT